MIVDAAVDRIEVGRGIVVGGKGTAAVADRTEVDRHWKGGVSELSGGIDEVGVRGLLVSGMSLRVACVIGSELSALLAVLKAALLGRAVGVAPVRCTIALRSVSVLGLLWRISLIVALLLVLGVVWWVLVVWVRHDGGTEEDCAGFRDLFAVFVKRKLDED